MNKQQAADRFPRPAPSTNSADNAWDSYWEGLDGQARVFREQAREHVQNLVLDVPLQPGARVLDFGCGFGFVACDLAPLVGELYLWDASPNMRWHARRNLAGVSNVHFLSTDSEAWNDAVVDLDIVLVNSVIQYMTPDEFTKWLKCWRSVLHPGGRVVISDIIPPSYSSLRDFPDILKLSARRGFLLQAIADGLREIAGYWKKRRARPLTRYGPEELARYATDAGLAIEILPRNLTHFPRRTTAVLTFAAPASDPHPQATSP